MTVETLIHYLRLCPADAVVFASNINPLEPGEQINLVEIVPLNALTPKERELGGNVVRIGILSFDGSQLWGS